MPIGTSDGQHFDDEFSQEVSKASGNRPYNYISPGSTMSPYNPNWLQDKGSSLYGDVQSQFVEDRRFSDPITRENPYGQRQIGANYLQQDLSRQEQNPMSQEAGINQIPVTNPHNVVFPKGFSDLLSELDRYPSPKLIDRTHEVPYVAGASKDGFVTHIDKSVPKVVVMSGKSFDPATPLAIHEQVEKAVMDDLIYKKGMSEDKAYQIAHHEYAQVAEDNWYRKNGINVEDMDKFWTKINNQTERDKKNFPPNLYTKPYPHDVVKGEKHTPSDIFKEGPPAGD